MIHRLPDTRIRPGAAPTVIGMLLLFVALSLPAETDAPSRGCGAATDTFVASIEHFPPEPPWNDDVYLVGTPASGVWTGQENALATREGSGWSFRYPCPGDTAYVENPGTRLFHQPFGVEQWIDLSRSRPWSIGEIGAQPGKLIALDDQALLGHRWLLIVDDLAQGLVLELPAAEAARNDGREVVIKNADPAFPIDVEVAGQAIEGVASVTVAPGGDLRLISAGGRWLVIGG